MSPGTSERALRGVVRRRLACRAWTGRWRFRRRHRRAEFSVRPATVRTEVTTWPGWRSKVSSRKSSRDCLVSEAGRAAGGKSARLSVTIMSAPPVIAWCRLHGNRGPPGRTAGRTAPSSPHLATSPYTRAGITAAIRWYATMLDEIVATWNPPRRPGKSRGRARGRGRGAGHGWLRSSACLVRAARSP